MLAKLVYLLLKLDLISQNGENIYRNDIVVYFNVSSRGPYQRHRKKITRNKYRQA